MKIIVVGAGIVGICCGSYLQRDGHDVTVLDPVPPGGSCSFGNSGSLSPGSCIPLGMPGIVRHIPSWLLDSDGPLRIDWRYVPKALPWLLKFLKASRRTDAMAAARALRALHEKTFESYMPLVAAAQAEDLIRRPGQLYVYESEESFEGDKLAMDIRRTHNVKLETLTGDEARAIEPNLSPAVRRAILFPESGHCTNPERLVQALAAALVGSGGVLRQERVVGFDFGSHGPRTVRTEGAAYPADAVIIAAGAWSGRLTLQFGDRVPLETLRGYHVVFRDPGIEPKMSVLSVSGKFSATPMEMGLRCGGTIEIAGFGKAPDFRRAAAIARQAKRLYPKLRTDPTTQWMGHRPGTPDSVPVIDRSTRFRNVYYAFGHGQTGLIGASMTGRLVADLVADRTPPIDMTPFRAGRFG